MPTPAQKPAAANRSKRARSLRAVKWTWPNPWLPTSRAHAHALTSGGRTLPTAFHKSVGSGCRHRNTTDRAPAENASLVASPEKQQIPSVETWRGGYKRPYLSATVPANFLLSSAVRGQNRPHGLYR